MKRTALSIALVTLAPSGGLGLHYDPGLVLEKSVRARLSVELTDISMQLKLDGETRTPEAPDVDLTLTSEEQIRLRDEVVASEDGRPTSVRRTYEAVSGSEDVELDGPDGSQSNRREGSSELEGETVVLRRNADEGGWSAEADPDSEVDPELLPGLAADTDLTVFLDPGAQEGDSWEVGAEAYTALRQFGGELAYLLEGEEEIPESRALFHENLEGGFEVTWEKTVEDAGRRLAVLSITGELESDYSPSPPDELPEGVSIEQEIAFEISLEGELRWDLDAGRLASLGLSGDVEITDTLSQQGSNEEHEFSSERTQVMQGELELEAAFEAE